ILTNLRSCSSRRARKNAEATRLVGLILQWELAKGLSVRWTSITPICLNVSRARQWRVKVKQWSRKREPWDSPTKLLVGGSRVTRCATAKSWPRSLFWQILVTTQVQKGCDECSPLDLLIETSAVRQRVIWRQDSTRTNRQRNATGNFSQRLSQRFLPRKRHR